MTATIIQFPKRGSGLDLSTREDEDPRYIVNPAPCPITPDQAETLLVLPEHSGTIGADLYTNWVWLLRCHGRYQYSAVHWRLKIGHRLYGTYDDEQRWSSWAIEVIDKETGIKRIYGCEGREAQWATGFMLKYAARFNVTKLRGGKIKPQFWAEAAAEVERQLGFLSLYNRDPERNPIRIVFIRFRKWREEHGLS